jgi:hypothetical protein
MYNEGIRIKYKSVENVAWAVHIYDTLSGPAAEATFTDVEGADTPANRFIVDNNERKESPIKAIQWEFKFLSTTTVNLNTFITPEDNRWYVEVLRGEDVKFRGFLVLDDCDEDFLDSDTSNIITLIATDNIGLLKDEPLTDFDGNNPRGYYSIIQYLAWCLQKTGLYLKINVVHNVREINNPDKIMYESCELHSKSFEAEINESVDCYEVLEFILKNDAFITQINGEWYVIRWDELQDDVSINNIYTWQGIFEGYAPFGEILNTDPNIDPNIEALVFSGMRTFVKVQMPVKSIRLTYNYRYPREIIDNIDFSRSEEPYWTGDPTYENDNEIVEKRYTIDDWTFLKNNHLPVTTEGEAYIQRWFVNAYEKERTIKLERFQPSTLLVESNPVPLGEGDKFTLSVDSKHSFNQSGSGSYSLAVMEVRLVGDDGTYWVLDGGGVNDEIPTWVQSNSAWSIARYVFHYGSMAEDKTNFKTTTVEAPPLPVDGLITISLQNSSNWGDVMTFQNLRFTYQPYINGSYAKFNGQYSKISQDLDTKKVYEDEVYMSDSPKRLFKGALHTFIKLPLFNATTGFIQSELYPNGIYPNGDWTNILADLDTFAITGTALNDGVYTIQSVYYDSNTNITRIVVNETVTQELAVTTTVFNKVIRSLAQLFYDGKQFGATVPAMDYLHPFGYNQAYCVWNQNNRAFRIFDFQIQGLNGYNTLPELSTLFRIQEVSDHTTNKLFMLVHFDQDTNLCEWTGLMIEVYDTSIPKDYLATLIFKYISGNE